MKEKLTLNDLCGYFPFDLKCQFIQDLRDEFSESDWIEDIEIFDKGAIWSYAGYADKDLCIPLGEGDFSGFLIRKGKTYASVGNSVKPIFRNLATDLTREITHGNETFVPYKRLWKISPHDTNNAEWFIEKENFGEIKYWIIQKLQEWHFWLGDQSYFEKKTILDYNDVNGL